MPPFDPYLNWLGIAPHDQPPNFYRLLGVVLFESNPEVIEQAADRQSLRVGSFQGGPQDELCQQLLSEIAMARFCLVDPQQKAAYDNQLNESLAMRGERAVAAPPPPASAVGAIPFNPAAPQLGPTRQFGPEPPQFGPEPPQFGQPSPQFGPLPSQFPQQAGAAGAFHPGNGMQMPPAMPGPMPPLGGGMPGPPAMSPQQMMQMPPAMMPAPSSFAPAMQLGPAPAAIPVAAPFPIHRASAVAAAPAAASPAAPVARPPAAPSRPIDELESLTSQPATRRRILKKRSKVDHTKEIIVGTVVAAGAILLIFAYIAFKSQDPAEHGLGGIKADDAVESLGAKLAEERKQKMKEIADKREKEKEKEKKAAAAKASAGGDVASPLRPLGDASKTRAKNSAVADGRDSTRIAPRNPDPSARSVDSRFTDRPLNRQSQRIDNDIPDEIGTENDIVMPPPEKK